MLQNWIINIGKPYIKYESYQIWGRIYCKNKVFEVGGTIDPKSTVKENWHPSCENPNEAPVNNDRLQNPFFSWLSL